MIRELPADEIHLYLASPDKISNPGLLSRYKSLLTEDELQQMLQFYFERHRHQYLITRALIRTTLSAYCQVEPALWRFGNNSFGKPEIRHPDQQLPIRFNLSHTDGLIMCGIVRDYDIGVDVEDTQRSTRVAVDSLSSYFSVQEIDALLELPVEAQKQRFFDYWTLKESYIKARGAGLSIPLSKFSFLFQGNKLRGFSVHPDLNDDAESWQFWRMPMAERYRIAVAIKSENNVFKLSAVNTVPLQSSESIPLTFL